jgi:transcriptional regulator with XRE-family HTH domain
MNKATKSNGDKKERNASFGLRLKAYRQAAQITQEQLAEYVSRSSETVSKMERGLIYPGVDMLILLADRLSTSLDSLVGTKEALGASAQKTLLVAEASSILNSMADEKLKVAVVQLKALQGL